MYNILELANVHGGDKEHLLSLINELVLSLANLRYSELFVLG